MVFIIMDRMKTILVPEIVNKPNNSLWVCKANKFSVDDQSALVLSADIKDIPFDILTYLMVRIKSLISSHLIMFTKILI